MNIITYIILLAAVILILTSKVLIILSCMVIYKAFFTIKDDEAE